MPGSQERYNSRPAYRAQYDNRITGTAERRRATSGRTVRENPAEQERDTPFRLRPGPGVEFDGLEEGALDAVAVFGEVPADEFGLAAGGGGGDKAVRRPVGNRGAHGPPPAADADDVRFGKVLQYVRGGAGD